ncbi:MAG: trypsin-like peptidase domain-containing protein, partial [Nitrospinota bacterium]|nr:trypsin-like peptidase domain-containing protein [Nitrospinota bacterium]
MRIWVLIFSFAVIFGAASTPAHSAEWRASGSGFYLKGTSHIMTNLHVVGSAKNIRVSFPVVGTYTGRVVARDANNDIAIIALRGMNPKTEGFHVNLDALIEPGMPVHAIGYPLNSGISIVSGQVSSTTGLDQNAAKFTMTAPINEGNSGGPVLDEMGNLIGIAQGGFVQRGVEAVRFATKISTSAIALGQARLTRLFSIRVVKKQKRLAPREIFRNFHQHVVRIDVQEAGLSPAQAGSVDIAALQNEVEAEERRLKEGKLREKLARLRKEREQLEARTKPPAKPVPRRQATYMPGGKRYPKTITGKDGAPMVLV